MRRCEATGQLMTEILPELWLLAQYMPHIAHPTYTSDQEQDLAILSEPAPEHPTENLDAPLIRRRTSKAQRPTAARLVEHHLRTSQPALYDGTDRPDADREPQPP
jgi:hypothetical protein